MLALKKLWTPLVQPTSSNNTIKESRTGDAKGALAHPDFARQKSITCSLKHDFVLICTPKFRHVHSANSVKQWPHNFEFDVIWIIVLMLKYTWYKILWILYTFISVVIPFFSCKMTLYLTDLKGKGNPGLTLVCSNYWTPIVAQ